MPYCKTNFAAVGSTIGKTSLVNLIASTFANHPAAIEEVSGLKVRLDLAREWPRSLADESMFGPRSVKVAREEQSRRNPVGLLRLYNWSGAFFANHRYPTPPLVKGAQLSRLAARARAASRRPARQACALFGQLSLTWPSLGRQNTFVKVSCSSVGGRSLPFLKMKPTLVCITIGSIAVVLAGCDKHLATAPVENGPRAALHLNSQPSGSASPEGQASVTRESVAVALRNGRKAGGSKEALEEFEVSLLLLADQEGVGPMAIAAQLVLDAGSLDEQEMMQNIVRIAFADTASQVELAKALPAGRLRELATSGLGNQLVAAGDLLGLKEAYNALPFGKDRTLTAQRAATLAMNQHGLGEALDFVVGLDLPEERYAAFFGTKKQWKSHWNDEGIASKVNAVINSLDSGRKARLAPMLRKTN